MKNEEMNVEELSKKYCKSKDFILLLIKICKDNNVKNIKRKVENYFI